MRILKDGICLDEKRLFSDVYNSVLEGNYKNVSIPLFNEGELDVLDSEFDFFNGDIEESELIKQILYQGETLALILVEGYEPSTRKFREYYNDGTFKDTDYTIERPY